MRKVMKVKAYKGYVITIVLLAVTSAVLLAALIALYPGLYKNVADGREPALSEGVSLSDETPGELSSPDVTSAEATEDPLPVDPGPAEFSSAGDAKEALLSDYKLYKNVMSQDEIEEILFAQPVSKARDGEMRIGVKTAIDGDFHAELTIYKAKDGKYEEIFSCPAVVGKNGPGKQAENDAKTPLGSWEIGGAYGIKKDPGSLLPYTKVTEDMYWCATASNGKKYNTLIRKSDDPDADYSEDEHLIDFGSMYYYFIDLGYNKAGVPYAGNAIFLHCWLGPDTPTGGCVGVSEESMVTVLRTVTPGTTVTVY